MALVVNTTLTPVKLKQGFFLSYALTYDRQIVPEPIEFSLACFGAVDQNSSSAFNVSEQASLDSLVKVMDYTEYRDSFLTLLNKYREVIALPAR